MFLLLETGTSYNIFQLNQERDLQNGFGQLIQRVKTCNLLRQLATSVQFFITTLQSIIIIKHKGVCTYVCLISLSIYNSPFWNIYVWSWRTPFVFN